MCPYDLHENLWSLYMKIHAPHETLDSYECVPAFFIEHYVRHA